MVTAIVAWYYMTLKPSLIDGLSNAKLIFQIGPVIPEINEFKHSEKWNWLSKNHLQFILNLHKVLNLFEKKQLIYKLLIAVTTKLSFTHFTNPVMVMKGGKSSIILRSDLL